MLYVAVAVGLLALIGIHELVVRVAVRTIRRPWAVLLGIPTGYLVLAGFALALYAGYGFRGEDRSYVVDGTLPGYDAAGKLESGDRILEADDVAVSPTGTTLVAQIDAAAGKPVVLTIERAGEQRDVTVQPKRNEVGKSPTWLLGVTTLHSENRVHDTGAAMKAAAVFPLVATRDLAVRLRGVILGNEEPELGGPVRITAAMFADSVRPVGIRALEILLRIGLYIWLALSILDLVRMVKLARQPPARSSAS